MSQNSSECSLPEQTAEQAADRSQSSVPTDSSIASSPSSSLQSLSLTTSVDEKNTKFKITLDSPNHEYYSGSVIRGTVSLLCKHRKKIRGKFKIKSSPHIIFTINFNTRYSSSQALAFAILLNRKKYLFIFNVSGIYFRIIGYGKCSWTDWLRRDSVTVDSKSERSFVQYSGTEEYINSTMYIVGSKNGKRLSNFVI